MQDTQKDFHKKLLGRTGEKIAIEFLKKRGYNIIEKNYKTRIGEIDIIATDKDAIVFVEVKTRKSDAFGHGAEAVDNRKQEKYFKVAAEYLQKNDKADVPCRFDVIELQDGKINHIQNAFYMTR